MTRRSKSITLVLMGQTLLLAGGCSRRDEEEERHRHHGAGTFIGRGPVVTGVRGSTAPSVSARGGFGSFGGHGVSS
ncbi:hypothetical protein [Singulisphaera sp. PoT]|uniref:hypothetical protein n=1 Tax=Singulisphaera sp. PoT TaxID=3411797 RepID=UPI003BF5B224